MKGFRCRARGGQRVFQFVSDVGREFFACFRASVERCGHLVEGARQLTNFVFAVTEVGEFVASIDVVADVIRCRRQLFHWRRNGTDQQERRHDRCNECHQHKWHDAPSFFVTDLLQLAGPRREQQDTMRGAHAHEWQGYCNDLVIIFIEQDGGARLAVQCGARQRMALGIRGADLLQHIELGSGDEA